MANKVVKRIIAKSPPFHLKHWKWLRLSLLLALDAIVILAAYCGAFLLRFDDLTFEGIYVPMFWRLMPIVVVINLVVFYWTGMYRQVWRYATLHSGVMILKATFIGSVLSVATAFLLGEKPPRSIFIIYGLLASILSALCRFFWRGWSTLQLQNANNPVKERCLIYGAGSGGDLLARHIAANPRFPYQVVGFLDDDRNKHRRLIHGFKILCAMEALEQTVREHQVDAVIMAIPSATGKMVRDTLARCQGVGVRCLIMPDLTNSLDVDFRPRAINVKDLLKRSPKGIDEDRVRALLRDRTVLVSGAGGSIGSEICRQVAEFGAKRLVLLDSSEFALYQIDTDLRDRGISGLELHPILGSMTDARVVESVFETFRPSIVLHAAAYKHVPLVEQNPQEGIINNIFGTRLLVDAANRHGVERFLLVSSDKAVRPTSVMGATKRCCELLIQSYQELFPNQTKFCAVRFGNVLGSSGSVVPRFLQQIQTGGPVTVTHPDITRYFMLISEAVGLVLQSISMSTGGEIFVLDMGEPVKIAEMAEQLIRLAGKEPGRDVEVVYSGLRPGEKLYEELILEGVEEPTRHDNIFVNRARGENPRETLGSINEIIDAASGEGTSSVALLRELIGTGKRPEPVGGKPQPAVSFH